MQPRRRAASALSMPAQSTPCSATRGAGAAAKPAAQHGMCPSSRRMCMGRPSAGAKPWRESIRQRTPTVACQRRPRCRAFASASAHLAGIRPTSRLPKCVAINVFPLLQSSHTRLISRRGAQKLHEPHWGFSPRDCGHLFERCVCVSACVPVCASVCLPACLPACLSFTPYALLLHGAGVSKFQTCSSRLSLGSRATSPHGWMWSIRVRCWAMSRGTAPCMRRVPPKQSSDAVVALRTIVFKTLMADAARSPHLLDLSRPACVPRGRPVRPG